MMANINDNKQHKPLVFAGDRDALLQRAFEANDGCVSVGGLAHELGMLEMPPAPDDRRGAPASKAEHEFNALRVALSRYVEFSRRMHKLSVEAFAAKAGIELDEVLQVEDEDALAPEPRVIFSIAAFLKADANKLMELAGHIQRRSESLGKEAVKFAAWSQGSEPLSRDEEKILRAFTEVVVESSDGS
jgi:transcriptional regulator with XRE-family HTH domain